MKWEGCAEARAVEIELYRGESWEGRGEIYTEVRAGKRQGDLCRG